jgi:hypothetical protein
MQVALRCFVGLILLGIITGGCSCGDNPGANDHRDGAGGDTNGSGMTDAGFLLIDGGFDDAGHPIDGGVIAADALPGGDAGFIFIDGGFNDAGQALDGGVVAADAAARSGGDAGIPDGNPLTEPHDQFCMGMGTVVEVGGSGGSNQCAGNIAMNTFRLGLCACETIAVQSTLSIDSFDSTLGAYGAPLPNGMTNVGDDGHLGINRTLNMSGKLTVSGSAFVAGSGGFSVGPESAVQIDLQSNGPATQDHSGCSIGHNAFINGDVNGRYTIAGDLEVPTTAMVSSMTMVGGRLIRHAISVRPPCPCGPTEILDIPSITQWAATHNDNAITHVLTATIWDNGGPSSITLPCGRYFVNRIQPNSGLSITAEGRTVLFVNGDMTIAGPLTVTLRPGAELDLFVAGSLSSMAALSLGDASAPSKVRTYIGGTGTIDLSASSSFDGNVYAPRAAVVFGASAQIFGSLFARTATFAGAAQVHFDSAIRHAGSSCTPDAGSAGTDGSVGSTDGSSGNADAGTADAGTLTHPDASVGQGCTGCLQCGNLACIIPPGQMSGMCSACSSDVDCCAPDVCRLGICVNGL